MGGAPPPPLGFAPQGGLGATFSALLQGRLQDPEDQAPQGGRGRRTTTNQFFARSESLGLWQVSCSGTSGGREHAQRSSRPWSQQDTGTGPKLAEMSHPDDTPTQSGVVSVTASATRVNNIAECVEHCLTGDEADVIRRATSVGDRTWS